MSDVGVLMSNNPSPFKQPFLVLSLSPDRSREWHVDVNGKIGLYLQPRKIDGTRVEVTDRVKDATELLKNMCRTLKEQGYPVYHVFTYNGSAGPSHILRNGVLFRRMKLEAKLETDVLDWMKKK